MSEGLGRPCERLLRQNQIIAPDGPIPVSASTWWRGIKSGRFPQPLKIGARITVWRESDIVALVKKHDDLSSKNDSNS